MKLLPAGTLFGVLLGILGCLLRNRLTRLPFLLTVGLLSGLVR
jgi:hypothetical protein